MEVEVTEKYVNQGAGYRLEIRGNTTLVVKKKAVAIKES